MSLKTTLFLRTIYRNREIYGLKIGSQAIAIACSILVFLFALDEFGYDRFHDDYQNVFRVLQKNTDPGYNGNRLSNRISPQTLDLIRLQSDSSTLFSRVKLLNGINVLAEGKIEYDQHVYAADETITQILSFDIVDGSFDDFRGNHSAIISSEIALKKFGHLNVSGKTFKAFTYGDTVEYTIAAVFKNYPRNSHEDFSSFVSFDSATIHNLFFSASDFGVYGKSMRDASTIHDIITPGEIGFKFQPISEIYFGPRVTGEESKHGDRYSITILLFITVLILILALSTTINLSTLAMPQRARELALKKLSGSTQRELILSSISESFSIVGISFFLSLIILVASSDLIHSMLSISPWNMFAGQITTSIVLLVSMVILLSAVPVVISLRFIQSTPVRLLSSKAITFPRLKALIVFVQMGISISLIVVSVVTRRQVNYSLIKEPGQNNDQLVYLDFPKQMTSRDLIDLRTNSSNPHIVDAIATSQLPDRISSKDLNSGAYFMTVDPGFKDFFGLKMIEGNWFGANHGDSIEVINQAALTTAKRNRNTIGVFENMGVMFNQPDKPVRLSVASYSYNYLCIRVLEVDIRKTLIFLSNYFSNENGKASVRLLSKPFEQWMLYQDQLNKFSVILTIISGVLSCCAIFGLSLSIVKDKLKEVAIHKLCGADLFNITKVLARKFVLQTLLVTLVTGPVIYIVVTRLLRTFIYSTHLLLLDFLFPLGYILAVIVLLCAFQVITLNRAQLSNALKN